MGNIIGLRHAPEFRCLLAFGLLASLTGPATACAPGQAVLGFFAPGQYLSARTNKVIGEYSDIVLTEREKGSVISCGNQYATVKFGHYHEEVKVKISTLDLGGEVLGNPLNQAHKRIDGAATEGIGDNVIK